MIQRSLYNIRKDIFYQLDWLLNFQWQMFKAYSEKKNKKMNGTRVSVWLLFNANSGIFQLHHGETNAPSWIFIVLAHWNNSSRVDMSLHSDILFWYQAN
jgi:hypothetical protein